MTQNKKTGFRPVVLLSNISHLLAHLFMVIFPTAVLGMEGEFGLGYAELIPLSLAGYMLFGGGALPAGWLGDRWSGTGMLIVMLLGLGAAAMVTGMASSPVVLSLGLALLGLSASIYHPVGLAMIVRHSEHKGRDLGVNGIYGSAGLSGGPLLAGLITDYFGWRSAFMLPGLGALAVGLAYLAHVGLGGLRENPPEEEKEYRLPTRRLVPVFLGLMVMTLCSGMIFQLNSVSMPKVFALRLGGVGGMSASEAGALVSIVFLGASLSPVLGGLMADRFQLRRVYVVLFFLIAPMCLGAAYFGGWPLFAFVLCVAMLYSSSNPAESALFVHYSPPRWHATALALKFLMALGASSLGVPLVGLIYDRTGDFFWLYALMGALALGAGGISLLLPEERPQVPAGEASP
ncbi:MAG: MFS transporter [Deltaproteobacteria bacterium]|nr:MFS transporter [Deltaproteobacteria bacterium]